MTMFPINLNI